MRRAPETSERRWVMAGDGLASNDERHDRKTQIIADLSKRLKNSCRHLSDREFAQLMEDMAERQLVGERRGILALPYERRPND